MKKGTKRIIWVGLLAFLGLANGNGSILNQLENENATLNIYYYPTEIFTLPLKLDDIKERFYYMVTIKNWDKRIYNDLNELNVDDLVSNIISQNKDSFDHFDYRVLAEICLDNKVIIAFGFTYPNDVGNVLIDSKHQGQDEILYKYFTNFLQPFINN